MGKNIPVFLFANNTHISYDNALIIMNNVGNLSFLEFNVSKVLQGISVTLSWSFK